MRATHADTHRFRHHFSDAAPGWFRRIPALDVDVSCLGLGTYLGPAHDAADEEYLHAMERAVFGGVNVFDTAANYRFQRSEKTIGELLRRGRVRREQLVLSTKGGYLAPEAPVRNTRAWFDEHFVAKGLAWPEDLAAACHCLAPGYLGHQLAQSLAHMGCDAVDIYYLHNPEQQLDEVDASTFETRLRHAFEWAEEQVAAGRIGLYGVATWDGLRVGQADRSHLELDRLVALAREVGGDEHHFGAVQLPFNLAMTEAAEAPTQRGDSQPLLAVAQEYGLCVMASAPLLQARLLPQVSVKAMNRLGVETAAQAALQFVRSTPGITTALCGMRDAEHVEDNTALRGVPVLAAG